MLFFTSQVHIGQIRLPATHGHRKSVLQKGPELQKAYAYHDDIERSVLPSRGDHNKLMMDVVADVLDNGLDTMNVVSAPSIMHNVAWL